MANLAFHHIAREYARFRPDYPAAVLDRLLALTGCADGRWALDLGCGTGQLTRPLASAGWNVIAADADELMVRTMLAGDSARTVAIHCVAESIGIATGSVSVVTCAQALHWFNPRYALPEIARVLRNSGGIAVFLWTDRCLSSPFIAEFNEFIRQWSPSFHHEYAEQDWCAKLRSTGYFDPPTDMTVNWIWRPTIDAFVGYAKTLTYLRNTVPRNHWPHMDKVLRERCAEHFPAGNCEIPLSTRFIVARRIAGTAKSM